MPTEEPKRSQREKARETARLAREEAKRRQRRNRLFAQGGIGIGILAIIAIVVIVVVNSNRTIAPVSAGHSPKNMAAGGILFEGSSGAPTPVAAPAKSASETPSKSGTVTSPSVPHVVTYIDWSCPVCKAFEAAYSSKLASLVGSGKMTLEIHPVAILDTHYQQSGYSTRAANAAACVANFAPDKFLAAQTRLYDKQPAEGTNGLTNSQIIGLLREAGAGTPSITSCVSKESYKAWVTNATQRTLRVAALADPSSGQFSTPTVFINGKRWSGSTDLIADITNAG